MATSKEIADEIIDDLPERVACEEILEEEIAAAIDEVRKQLPEGMRECTIEFKECKLGHGWLTATNWVQHPCPTCERDKLRADLALLEAECRARRARPNHDWDCICIQCEKVIMAVGATDAAIPRMKG